MIVLKTGKKLKENQTGKKIKRFKTDNGLEFCSDFFTDYYRKAVIARHKIVVKTPQQNDLAERFNRTILERVRCMLLAIMDACYLINMCPSIAINMKTLEEVWSGHPPSYDRLRVFGCVTYAHIRQDKLEPRAIKCMFL